MDQDCCYAGYGTTCTVACDVPDGCAVPLSLHWSGGGYCCGTFENGHTDCVCEGGTVVCATYPGGPRSTPRSTCELCNRDGGPPDGGRCTDEPVEASCKYQGYGVRCPVACDFPADCTFDVTVTWTGDLYCCSPFDVDRFTDCICQDGTAFCSAPWASGGQPREMPWSTCEFCGEGDSGVDAALDDAGVEP